MDSNKYFQGVKDMFKSPVPKRKQSLNTMKPAEEPSIMKRTVHYNDIISSKDKAFIQNSFQNDNTSKEMTYSSSMTRINSNISPTLNTINSPSHTNIISSVSASATLNNDIISNMESSISFSPINQNTPITPITPINHNHHQPYSSTFISTSNISPSTNIDFSSSNTPGVDYNSSNNIFQKSYRVAQNEKDSDLSAYFDNISFNPKTESLSQPVFGDLNSPILPNFSKNDQPNKNNESPILPNYSKSIQYGESNISPILPNYSKDIQHGESNVSPILPKYSKSIQPSDARDSNRKNLLLGNYKSETEAIAEEISLTESEKLNLQSTFKELEDYQESRRQHQINIKKNIASKKSLDELLQTDFNQFIIGGEEESPSSSFEPITVTKIMEEVNNKATEEEKINLESEAIIMDDEPKIEQEPESESKSEHESELESKLPSETNLVQESSTPKSTDAEIIKPSPLPTISKKEQDRDRELLEMIKDELLLKGNFSNPMTNKPTDPSTTTTATTSTANIATITPTIISHNQPSESLSSTYITGLSTPTTAFKTNISSGITHPPVKSSPSSNVTGLSNPFTLQPNPYSGLTLPSKSPFLSSGLSVPPMKQSLNLLQPSPARHFDLSAVQSQEYSPESFAVSGPNGPNSLAMENGIDSSQTNIMPLSSFGVNNKENDMKGSIDIANSDAVTIGSLGKDMEGKASSGNPFQTFGDGQEVLRPDENEGYRGQMILTEIKDELNFNSFTSSFSSLNDAKSNSLPRDQKKKKKEEEKKKKKEEEKRKKKLEEKKKKEEKKRKEEEKKRKEEEKKKKKREEKLLQEEKKKKAASAGKDEKPKKSIFSVMSGDKSAPSSKKKEEKSGTTTVKKNIFTLEEEEGSETGHTSGKKNIFTLEEEEGSETGVTDETGHKKNIFSLEEEDQSSLHSFKDKYMGAGGKKQSVYSIQDMPYRDSHSSLKGLILLNDVPSKEGHSSLKDLSVLSKSDSNVNKFAFLEDYITNLNVNTKTTNNPVITSPPQTPSHKREKSEEIAKIVNQRKSVLASLPSPPHQASDFNLSLSPGKHPHLKAPSLLVYDSADPEASNMSPDHLPNTNISRPLLSNPEEEDIPVRFSSISLRNSRPILSNPEEDDIPVRFSSVSPRTRPISRTSTSLRYSINSLMSNFNLPTSLSLVEGGLLAPESPSILPKDKRVSLATTHTSSETNSLRSKSSFSNSYRSFSSELDQNIKKQQKYHRRSKQYHHRKVGSNGSHSTTTASPSHRRKEIDEASVQSYESFSSELNESLKRQKRRSRTTTGRVSPHIEAKEVQSKGSSPQLYSNINSLSDLLYIKEYNLEKNMANTGDIKVNKSRFSSSSYNNFNVAATRKYGENRLSYYSLRPVNRNSISQFSTTTTDTNENNSDFENFVEDLMHTKHHQKYDPNMVEENILDNQPQAPSHPSSSPLSNNAIPSHPAADAPLTNSSEHPTLQKDSPPEALTLSSNEPVSETVIIKPHPLSDSPSSHTHSTPIPIPRRSTPSLATSSPSSASLRITTNILKASEGSKNSPSSPFTPVSKSSIYSMGDPAYGKRTTSLMSKRKREQLENIGKIVLNQKDKSIKSVPSVPDFQPTELPEPQESQEPQELQELQEALPIVMEPEEEDLDLDHSDYIIPPKPSIRLNGYRPGHQRNPSASSYSSRSSRSSQGSQTSTGPRSSSSLRHERASLASHASHGSLASRASNHSHGSHASHASHHSRTSHTSRTSHVSHHSHASPTSHSTPNSVTPSLSQSPGATPTPVSTVSSSDSPSLPTKPRYPRTSILKTPTILTPGLENSESTSSSPSPSPSTPNKRVSISDRPKRIEYRYSRHRPTSLTAGLSSSPTHEKRLSHLSESNVQTDVHFDSLPRPKKVEYTNIYPKRSSLVTNIGYGTLRSTHSSNSNSTGSGSNSKYSDPVRAGNRNSLASSLSHPRKVDYTFKRSSLSTATITSSSSLGRPKKIEYRSSLLSSSGTSSLNRPVKIEYLKKKNRNSTGVLTSSSSYASSYGKGSREDSEGKRKRIRYGAVDSTSSSSTKDRGYALEKIKENEILDNSADDSFLLQCSLTSTSIDRLNLSFSKDTNINQSFSFSSLSGVADYLNPKNSTIKAMIEKSKPLYPKEANSFTTSITASSVVPPSGIIIGPDDLKERKIFSLSGNSSGYSSSQSTLSRFNQTISFASVSSIPDSAINRNVKRVSCINLGLSSGSSVGSYGSNGSYGTYGTYGSYGSFSFNQHRHTLSTHVCISDFDSITSMSTGFKEHIKSVMSPTILPSDAPNTSSSSPLKSHRVEDSLLDKEEDSFANSSASSIMKPYIPGFDQRNKTFSVGSSHLSSSIYNFINKETLENQRLFLQTKRSNGLIKDGNGEEPEAGAANTSSSNMLNTSDMIPSYNVIRSSKVNNFRKSDIISIGKSRRYGNKYHSIATSNGYLNYLSEGDNSFNNFSLLSNFSSDEEIMNENSQTSTQAADINPSILDNSYLSLNAHPPQFDTLKSIIPSQNTSILTQDPNQSNSSLKKITFDDSCDLSASHRAIKLKPSGTETETEPLPSVLTGETQSDGTKPTRIKELARQRMSMFNEINAILDRLCITNFSYDIDQRALPSLKFNQANHFTHPLGSSSGASSLDGPYQSLFFPTYENQGEATSLYRIITNPPMMVSRLSPSTPEDSDSDSDGDRDQDQDQDLNVPTTTTAGDKTSHSHTNNILPDLNSSTMATIDVPVIALEGQAVDPKTLASSKSQPIIKHKKSRGLLAIGKGLKKIKSMLKGNSNNNKKKKVPMLVRSSSIYMDHEGRGVQYSIEKVVLCDEEDEPVPETNEQGKGETPNMISAKEN